MHKSFPLIAASVFFLAATPAYAQQRDPAITSLVASVNADTLQSWLTSLVGFGTRHTLSDTVSSTRGIGAARRWIHQKFTAMSRECGGCLEVSFDPHFAANGRTSDDTVKIVNVVAKLPGRSDPNRIIIIEGHYDSCICSVDMMDAMSDAPGANDDGSGTVAVMELARTFSRAFPRGLEATVMFVAVAGEEQGLLGSTGLANALAANEDLEVYAALTSDIAGNVQGQKGGIDSTSIRVFSGEPANGPSRQLARYVEQIGELYVPNLDVRVIERLDRIGRGGDHIPFWRNGFAAVRFTESLENYLHQHRPEDRIEFVSLPYVQKLARVNGAASASLALAPAPPDSLRMRRVIESGGADWNLTWKAPRVANGIAGYEVTIRSTTEPRISKVVPVGNVTAFLLEDTQADDLWIGIRSIGTNGHRSIVRSFHAPERTAPPRR